MYKKKTYLIDSENVGTLWKKILPHKNIKDRIIVFYTDNTPYISFADLIDICKYPNSFENIKCNTGKNGLDFQLVSYLGFLLKSCPKTDYYIISKDTGYDSVCKFWCNLGYSVNRTDLISDDLFANPISISDPDEKKTEQLKTITLSIPSEYLSEPDLPITIYDLLSNYNLNTELQQIYSQFLYIFGQEKGINLYHALKPTFKDLV